MNDKFQIAISGNPKGQQLFGDEAAREYAQSLYNDKYNKETDNYVLCDTREENGIACFYYSYIVPNTIEVENRTGGVLGIVIRSEGAFCEDMARLYQLFVQLYEKKFEGVFIDRQKRFLVSEIEKGKAEGIVNALKKQLTNCFAASFTPLESNLPKPNGKGVLRCHVSDKGCDLFIDEFLSYGSAVLSPAIPRANERSRQVEEELNKERANHKTTATALQNSKREFANKETKLQETRKMLEEIMSINSNLKTEKSKLETEVDSLNRQIKTNKPIIPEKVDELIHLLKAYNTKTKQANGQGNNGNSVNAFVQRNKKKIILAFVVLAILIAGTVTAIKPTKTSPKEISLDNTEAQQLHDDKLKNGDVIKFSTSSDVKVKMWGLDGIKDSLSDDSNFIGIVKKQSGDTVTISFTTAEETGDKKYKHKFIIE